MSHKVITLFFLLVCGLQAALAQELPHSSESALSWLKKMTDAPRKHNYSGTFVYYADSHMETSRIIHKTDQTGEHEKIEVLDGTPRIVFRNNDEMKCYVPGSKEIYIEKSWFRKFFPNLFPHSLDDIDSNYYVKEVKLERVIDHECQVLSLIPRDSLRYGHQFWIDKETGILLKVAVTGGNEVIEQFAFVQLEIDGEINSDLLKPEHSIVFKDEWKVTDLVASISKEDELKWQVRNLPAGFKKLAEMRRNLVGKPKLVNHIALSDGLATVSIFIEPVIKDAPAPVSGFFSGRGAINIYVRLLDDNKITTIGEVPLETIKLISDSVFRQD